MELNYDELVKGYYHNLDTNLRNFRGGPGFLETWAHDEDHGRSLAEIIYLAQSAGKSELNVVLSLEVAASLDLRWLQNEVADLGEVKLENENGKPTLVFKEKSAPVVLGAFAVVDPYYRAAIQKLSSEMAHQKTGLSSDPDNGIYAAESEECTLACQINDNDLVEKAYFEARNPVLAAMLEGLCRELETRPIQEGAEHGTLRLERDLRSEEMPRKLKGLLTIKNAGDEFKTIHKLVNEVLKKHMVATGHKKVRNEWEDPVSPEWSRLTPEEQTQQATKLVLEVARELGLQDEDVEVVSVKNHVRWILSFKQKEGAPDFGNALIRLEKWIDDRLGFKIDLQRESLEDRNKREQRTQRN